MTRFVILEHHSPRGLHWDFLLQRGESLATWALAQAPVPQAAIAAQALPDHRLVYLDYEGPISGGRGTVVRWDWGTFEAVQWDAQAAVVLLWGTRLCGEVRLTRAADRPDEWSFVFTPRQGGR